MPKYTYKCLKCEKVFNLHHLMAESVENCFNSACFGKLEKLPPGAINIVRSGQKSDDNKEVGALAKETIESARKDRQEEREEASKRMYEASKRMYEK